MSAKVHAMLTPSARHLAHTRLYALLVRACLPGTYQAIFQSDMKHPEHFKPKDELKALYPPGTLLVCTKTGSANQRTLDMLLEAVVKTYDGKGGVKNHDGLRIVVKLDGGPALKLGDIEWLLKWWNRGVVFFPGLPNGSSVNQEMDQLCVKVTVCLRALRCAVCVRCGVRAQSARRAVTVSVWSIWPCTSTKLRPAAQPAKPAPAGCSPSPIQVQLPQAAARRRTRQSHACAAGAVRHRHGRVEGEAGAGPWRQDAHVEARLLPQRHWPTAVLRKPEGACALRVETRWRWWLQVNKDERECDAGVVVRCTKREQVQQVGLGLTAMGFTFA